MKNLLNKNGKIFNFLSASIVLFILFWITIIFSFTSFCYGETSSYFYITQNTLLIPTGQNIKGNVQIGATYYVQASGKPDVTINDISYKNVIYNGITGLVASSALSKKSISNISSPFFKSESLLTATSNEDDILMFFNITDEQTQCIKITNNSKLEFIAYSEDGKFVLCKLSSDNSKVGYILKKHCTPTIIFSPNPNPINPDEENKNTNLIANDTSSEQPQSDKAKITRIVLISVLCLFAVLVVFLIFKPVSIKQRKKSCHDDFYDAQ